MSCTPPRAEPVADPLDEVLGRRGARRQPDRLDSVEPALVDRGLVLDQVGRHAGRARGLDQPVRVGAVLRADHEQEVDLARRAA